MVEVFRTDVTNNLQARNLVGVIEGTFEGYRANFDLEDRDHILRIEVTDVVNVTRVIKLLKGMGVTAEVLPDDVEDLDFLLPGRSRNNKITLP